MYQVIKGLFGFTIFVIGIGLLPTFVGTIPGILMIIGGGYLIFRSRDDYDKERRKRRLAAKEKREKQD